MRRFLLALVLPALLLLPAVLIAQTSARLPAPTLTADHEGMSVAVSWEAVTGAVRYHLWVWTEAEMSQRLDDNSQTNTVFDHNGLEAGVRYWYIYRAVFESGETSEWSEYSSVTIALPIPVPVLSAALDGSAVSLSWTEVTQAARYQLWIWDSVNLWRLIDNNIQDTTYRHSGIDPGTAYYFTMRAQDAAGRNSGWADYVYLEVPTDVATETATPTATPTAASATVTPTPTSTLDSNSSLLQGITITTENRCSTYDSDDYSYPQSVEQQIVSAMGGRIYSPYTGEYFTSTRETDIEHIVARSEAHDSGLCAASLQTRQDFSRDLDNLTLASPEVNRRQKIAKDVAEWLPDQNKCWYVNQVVAVKREYGLSMDSAEAHKAVEILSGCTSVAMIFLSATSPTATPTATPGSQTGALAMYDDNGDGRITCAEARNHGIAPVHRGHPAYPFMDDRDNDGVVCE